MADIPLIVNELVIPPLGLSTLTAYPVEPPLGAVMAHGPITYGLPGVPFPAVTQAHPAAKPGAVKPASEVMVMAPCCGAPASRHRKHSPRVRWVTYAY